jgi:hypothetical protein
MVGQLGLVWVGLAQLQHRRAGSRDSHVELRHGQVDAKAISYYMVYVTVFVEMDKSAAGKLGCCRMKIRVESTRAVRLQRIDLSVILGDG